MPQVINLLSDNFSNFKPLKKNYSKIWNRYKKQKDFFDVIAIKKEKVLAYGTVKIQSMIRGGKIAHIEDIVVDYKHRKNGLGTNILKKIYKFCIKNKCHKIVLSSERKSFKFYKKNNYKIIGNSLAQMI